MRKTEKVYCVEGMMEYHTNVHVGSNRIKVVFSGGSINRGCAQPARYKTRDVIEQQAIERSRDFRYGRIKLEREEDLGEDIAVYRNASGVDEGQGTGPSHGSAEAEGTAEAAAGAEGHAAGPSDDTPEAETPESEGADEAAEATAGELEVIEVSCKDVAKQYLADHYGENPAPLRTRADVQECAAKYGIVFKFD